MLLVSEALELILSHFQSLNDENILVQNALNRVLKDPIYATLDLPPFDNSSMDGFAVRSVDTRNASKQNPVILSVIADIPAGISTDITIGRGESARIVTGAMLPNGADAVIPVEKTNVGLIEPGSKPPNVVHIFTKVGVWEYVRNRGQDIQKDQLLVKSNNRLGPQDIGVIAMQGIEELRVYKQPMVGIFSTGEELLRPGEPWKPGRIYDSNLYTLMSQCTQNHCNAINLGISTDTEGSIRTKFNTAINNNVDLILTSAGVSMGAYDFVRNVLESDGTIALWRVNMRPGKPLLFGSFKNTPVIGLPGNPVSAFIGFEVFVKPVLNKMSGCGILKRYSYHARLIESIESDGRESYLRVIVSGSVNDLSVKLTGHQGSGNLFSLVEANGIMIIPEGVKQLTYGDEVEVWPLKASRF